MLKNKQLSKDLFFNRPTDVQYDVIKKYCAVSSDDLVVVKIRAADNLLTRDLSRWGKDALSELAALMPGVPLTLDHDWDEVSKHIGKVFAASVRVSDINGPYTAEAINKAGNFNFNRQIVADEGYVELVADCYLKDFNHACDRILSGEYSHVSQGGFRYRDVGCPNCKTSFFDAGCPHRLREQGEFDPVDDDDIAPYYIRQDVFDMGELSVVSIPNLPMAQVLLAESLAM